MSLVLVTLKATYRSGVTAQPMWGSVLIEPLERRTSPADDIIYTADAESFVLDDSGGLQAIVATGDLSSDPAYEYRITERIGNTVGTPYEVVIPSMPGGSVVNLADLQDGTWLSADIKPGGFGGF